jgi:hypothetical protein
VLVLALPFTDAFTRSDGAIAGQWTGATWTIATNAAINTPTLGAELLTNPGFEGTYDAEAASLNVAPDWSQLNCETDGSDVLAESATAHGGSKSQQINVNAAAEGIQTDATPLATVGGWYQLSAWFNITSGTANILDASNVMNKSLNTTGSWVQAICTGRVTVANRKVHIRSATAANFLADDASAKQLTLASCFATLPSVGVNAVTAQVIVTVTPGQTQAGLVVNLDSTSSPANFVIAYLTGDSTRAKVDKCVAGVYTNIIDGAVTFGATKNLKLVKSGDDYSLYYGAPGSEAQVGTTQTAAGMTGTIHGLFATHPTAKFDTYQLAAT